MQRFGGIYILKMAKTKHLFMITVFLLVVIFIMGMLIGRWLGSSRVDEIAALIQNNELNTDSYLIEQELIENFEQGNCMLANARISSLSKELWGIGKILSPADAEEKLGKENYNFMKRKFHLMQIRTYILFYKIRQHCSNTGSVVLFYFSRDDNESEEQGEILDSLVADYDIRVFAVEYNYSEELSFIEDYYEIKTTPTLVIDYSVVLEGLSSYDETHAILRG
jgi:hypothetical protein